MKVRVISAIVVLALFIPLLIIGGYPFAIVMGIIGVLAYNEILELKKSHHPIPNIMKVLGLISVVYLALGNYGNNMLSFKLVLAPLLLILLPSIFYKKDKFATSDAFYLVGAVYLVGILFNLLVTLRNVNVNVLIYLLCISIITDTFAYFIGMLIGKHKMAKSISPGKSWEGFGAGVLMGTIIPLIVYINIIGSFSIRILIITMILSIIGQLGDLFYSKIKRENDIKDFSNIMPGHGGVLDRLDSLSFIVFTYIILIWTI